MLENVKSYTEHLKLKGALKKQTAAAKTTTTKKTPTNKKTIKTLTKINIPLETSDAGKFPCGMCIYSEIPFCIQRYSKHCF